MLILTGGYVITFMSVVLLDIAQKIICNYTNTMQMVQQQSTYG